MKGERCKAISAGDFLLWRLKKSVEIKEISSKLLDFCPGKAKTSQKLLISLYFSVLSGKNRLILVQFKGVAHVKVKKV